MEDKENRLKKYVEAKKRVDSIKGFYFQLIKYTIITILILSFKGRIIEIFMDKGIENPNILQWMEWNILAIPIIWGIILFIKGLSLFVFKSNRIKNWEQRQIEK